MGANPWDSPMGSCSASSEKRWKPSTLMYTFGYALVFPRKMRGNVNSNASAASKKWGSLWRAQAYYTIFVHLTQLTPVRSKQGGPDSPSAKEELDFTRPLVVPLPKPLFPLHTGVETCPHMLLATCSTPLQEYQRRIQRHEMCTCLASVYGYASAPL